MTSRRRFAALCTISLLGGACGDGQSLPGVGGSGGDGATGGSAQGGSGNGNGSGGAGGTDAGGGSGGVAEPAGPIAVGRVRTEYRVNPLGIDVTEPRLDWQLTSELKDEKQTAYQVLTASTPELLAANQGDLWDSGKVDSAASIQVAYAGKPLASRQRAYWKVKVWDKDGLPSAWSEPAFWEMGLLEKSDFEATWMTGATGLDAPGVNWIWYAEGDPASNAPEGVRFFRKTFNLAAAPVSVTCTATGDNDYELFLNGVSLGGGTEWNEQRVWSVGELAVVGKNVLAVRAHNVDGAAGFVASIQASFAGSPPVTVPTDASWKASNASEASLGAWKTAAYDDSSWTAAKSLVAFGSGVWKHPGGGSPQYLRRGFTLDKPVKRARIYATALGIYELWLNGKRVGEDFLAPGWTDYTKRLQIQTYDVTSLVTQGQNGVGAILADGWYTGKVGYRGRGQFFGPGPNRMLVQLEVESTDGSVQTISSGSEGWKSGAGPILAADLLDGETYDARLAMDWTSPSFDTSGWADAKPVTDTSTRKLVFDATDHVRVQLEIEPKTIKEQAPGVFVYDLGQNMVGWARLRVKGAAGARLRLRFAEVLNPDGSIYVDNLRNTISGYAGAKATDTYVLRGGDEETYEPRFTTHGFRYVELSGDVGKLEAPPASSTITGVVAHSHMPETGKLETSSPIINQLVSNIVWGQRGNFVSVPTDCPQRDERLGWMGDAQVFVRTATLNMDVASFFTKWSRDVDDAQAESGAFFDTSPNPTFVGSGTPAWGDAGVIVPFTIYEAYGDLRQLAEHYPNMVRWVEYISSRNADKLWKTGRGSDFGDWLSIDADTDKELLATAFFAYSTRLVAKSAKLLDEQADANKYESLFESIRSAFQAAYVQPDGKLKGDTQTAYALALRFDLLTAEQREKAGQFLRDDVARGHLSSGFIGVGHLLPALSAAGHTDVAYQLLNTDTFPSWLYSVKMGATTIWERWNGIKPNGDFETPVMNSFNHYSFGAVGEWLYGTVGGIQPAADVAAYSRFVLAPAPGGGISSARASLDTPYGTIVSDWKVDDGTFELSATIPVNTRAQVILPSKQGLTLDGASAAPDEGGAIELGSGHYTLTAKMP